MLVHEYLARAADHDPSRVALVSGTAACTYAELQRRAAGLSAFLRARGVVTGDRIVIFLPNSVEAVVSIFGVSAAGGCFVIADPSSPGERLRYIIEHSDAAAVIAPAAHHDMIRNASADCVRQPHLYLVGNPTPSDHVTSFDGACGADPMPPPPELTSSDRAAIIYTSGSTGQPKGVTLSHGNFDAVSSSVAAYLGQTARDVVLSVLQLAFGYGLLQLLVSVRSGGRLILRRGFGFPYDIVRTFVAERVTGFAGVPTLYAMLLQLEGLEHEDLAAMRYVTNAAAAMPTSFIPRLQTIFPNANIFLMHGQTECLRTSFLPPSEVGRIPTSIGKGMPNVELWLEDEHGRRPEPGDVGEMMVHGPGIMLGYWNDPTATAAVIRTGGTPDDRVLRTRDLFTTDADGFFYFVGRTDDIIKSRGEKVSPHEIEQLLFAHDEVLEARVIGIADDLLGQAIKAEVVPLQGADLTDRAIKVYLREHLEDYKIPKIVEFVESLPKSSSGKVRRT